MTQEAELGKAKAEHGVLICACDLRAVIFIALVLLENVGLIEDIKFPLKKRKGKDFSPSSRDHRMSRGKKKCRAQKYLFCDQSSKMVGSVIRRHFETH